MRKRCLRQENTGLRVPSRLPSSLTALLREGPPQETVKATSPLNVLDGRQRAQTLLPLNAHVFAKMIPGNHSFILCEPTLITGPLHSHVEP